MQGNSTPNEPAVPHGFRPGSARAALAYPDFRRMWIGSFASNIGTWMQNVVLPAYVYERTGKASIVGLLVFAQLGPLLLLSIPAGVIADRFDRRRWLIAMQLVQLTFSVLLFRAFVATIPKELDEAAVIEGAGPIALFFRVILPLMKPVVVTNIVVQSVGIFNDFTNPLYYLPGARNATVQLTLYNFQSMFNTSYNLLFMNILLITIPPLIMFLFFNGKIVEGMTAGAVKG